MERCVPDHDDTAPAATAPGARRAAACALSAALLATACGGDRGGGRAAVVPLRVAVSIFPLYDLTRRVAGERVETLLVLPAGREAHAFSIGPRDALRLEGARLVISVGQGLDDWIASAVERVSTGPVQSLTLGAELELLRTPSGAPDPHVWLDPLRMRTAVDRIAGALARLDPEHAEGYLRRGSSVERSLADLDGELRARTAGWSRRSIVTAHPFLTYYCERYGPRLAATIEGTSAGGVTPRSLSRILAAVDEHEVVAIFSQAQEDPAAARSLGEESGVPVHALDPLGGGPGAESYEALLRGLTAAIERALP